MTDHSESADATAPFRWRNCRADIDAARHDQTIELYLSDVVLPALETLNTRIALLGASDDWGDAFLQGEVEEVLIETKLAFGLAVQSLWERQFRAYLKACARELHPNTNMERKLEKADWAELIEHFHRLRGIRLETFPSFTALDTLQHLGNAGRHGDGASARELRTRCPDFWRPSEPLPDWLGPSEPLPLTVSMIDLPVARLEEFVAAIAGFWRDAGYIYNESIACKHEGLIKRLGQDRRERTWLPTMSLADPGRVE